MGEVRSLPVVPLKGLAASTALLQENFSVPAHGTLNITARITGGATAASIQVSHDGGQTWGKIPIEGGGTSLGAGNEQPYSVWVRRGESLQVSVDTATSLDVLDVFFVCGQAGGGS